METKTLDIELEMETNMEILLDSELRSLYFFSNSCTILNCSMKFYGSV